MFFIKCFIFSFVSLIVFMIRMPISKNAICRLFISDLLRRTYKTYELSKINFVVTSILTLSKITLKTLKEHLKGIRRYE